MIIIADVDGTITPSTQFVPFPMAQEIARSMNNGNVHVFISGSTCDQIFNQISGRAPFQYSYHLLGTSGSRYDIVSKTGRISYRTCVYAIEMLEGDRAEWVDIFEHVTEALNLPPDTTKEDQIQDRVTQVTLSVLGRHADAERKRIWDAFGSKRARIIEWIQETYPHVANRFEMRIGGTTSIDVVPKGFNKAHGIAKWMTHNKWASLKDIIFIGDQLEEGGNDEPVRGLLSRKDIYQVSHWREAATLLSELA